MPFTYTEIPQNESETEKHNRESREMQVRANYENRIKDALNKIPVVKPADFESAVRDLQKILTSQPKVLPDFDPELKESMKRIYVIYTQMYFKHVGIKEIFDFFFPIEIPYVESSDNDAEYQQIIKIQIQEKINEFNSFTLEEKNKYISDHQFKRDQVVEVIAEERSFALDVTIDSELARLNSKIARLANERARLDSKLTTLYREKIELRSINQAMRSKLASIMTEMEAWSNKIISIENLGNELGTQYSIFLTQLAETVANGRAMPTFVSELNELSEMKFRMVDQISGVSILEKANFKVVLNFLMILVVLQDAVRNGLALPVAISLISQLEKHSGMVEKMESELLDFQIELKRDCSLLEKFSREEVMISNGDERISRISNEEEWLRKDMRWLVEETVNVKTRIQVLERKRNAAGQSAFFQLAPESQLGRTGAYHTPIP